MSTEGTGEREPRRSLWHWPLIALLLLVVFTWVGSCVIINKQIPPTEGIDHNAVRGQFGDKFGAVNSLFSGLAFACLVYAIVLQYQALRLQQRELALQRKELELQREELRLSRQELAAQNALIAKQVQAATKAVELEMRREKATEDARLICVGKEAHSLMVRYDFYNTGGGIYGLELITPANAPATLHPRHELRNGGHLEIQFQVVQERPKIFMFSIRYTTKTGAKRSEAFFMDGDKLPVRVPDDEDADSPAES